MLRALIICESVDFDDNMRKVHLKYNLSEFHLDAFKDCLVRTLKEQNVPAELAEEVIRVVERRRGDITSMTLKEMVGGDQVII